MAGAGDIDLAVLRDPVVDRVLSALDGEGEEARIVGGAVRNSLIGQPPGDIDIATTALPEEVIRRAKAAGFGTAPTGLAHGTVTVILDRRPFEVTTLRRDVDTDGRHAKVAFGRDWAEDARRRDFTFNALSLSRDGRLHDVTGGRDDLMAGRVRFIGDARQRIREDYLRILRFFRFHASYGRGAPDAEGLKAAISERHGLARLSRERVRAELMRLLVAPAAAPVLQVMDEAGFLLQFLAGVARSRRLARLVHLEGVLQRRPDPLARLAALGLFVREDAERLRDRLRLSNGEYDRLSRLADGLPWPEAALSSHAARVLLYRLGAETFVQRCLLAWADAGDPEEGRWRVLVELPARWPVPRLPWSGADLLAAGMHKGPAVGLALRDLEEAWIAADFPEDAGTVDRLMRTGLDGL
jgi:poly(A) polymerase